MKSRRFKPSPSLLAILLALLVIAFGLTTLHYAVSSDTTRAVLAIVMVGAVMLLLRRLLKSLAEPLRVLTNVLEAYRRGDYSIRSARQGLDSALSQLADEVNRLGDSLREQRSQAMEANALLHKLITSIDVAILAFDGDCKLRSFNPAALALLGVDEARAMGRHATELGLAGLLEAQLSSQVVVSICGRTGRWQVTHGTFREEGLAQHLLVISDLRHVLREEERFAWQRLLRVIGHEVNNSLTPIKSIAESLHEALGATLATGELRDDALSGLNLMASRATALMKFLEQYRRLNQLAPPQRRWVQVAPLLRRVAQLESGQCIEVQADDHLEAHLDEVQIEHALINLVRNAVEAQGGVHGRIVLSATCRGAFLDLVITDEGSSIANPDNLFVPFFTTKPGGSGIGLALSRQIAEAHGGTLLLANRADAPGAIATLQVAEAIRQFAVNRGDPRLG